MFHRRTKLVIWVLGFMLPMMHSMHTATSTALFVEPVKGVSDSVSKKGFLFSSRLRLTSLFFFLLLSSTLAILDIRSVTDFGDAPYEAVKVYKGKRVIASKGEAGANWRVYKLVSYCACGKMCKKAANSHT